MIFDWLYAIGALVVSVGGGAGVVFGLFRFYGNVLADHLLESVRAKYASELEKLKSDYRHEVESQLQTLRDQQERGQFVHRLQFETEFNAYVELWRRFAAARRAMATLRPFFDHAGGKTHEELKNERLPVYRTAVDAFKECYLFNMPFCSPPVQDAVMSIAKVLHEEDVDYSRGRPHEESYDRSAEANAAEIERCTKLLRDAIRERIGTLALSDDGATRLVAE